MSVLPGPPDRRHIVTVCADVLQVCLLSGHALAPLVEGLRYNPESRGFDSRWCD
jgi:hypothetical protein